MLLDTQKEVRLISIGASMIIAFGMFSSLIINRDMPKVEVAYGSWACTADVKVCPDGREVGRTPPYCHFAEC